MQGLKNKLLQEHMLVFMFCMAIIMGPAISTLFAYDLTQLKDSKTYLGLAHFDFNQSPVRRYRVIVPFAAAILDKLFGGVFNKLAPTYFAGDFSIPFSFFLVNMFLMSYFGLLVYRYCKAFGVSRAAALVGLLALLTCRYTVYLAALPLVDSLFCVVVALTLLGIKTKNTKMLLWAIFIGPFAKEAFIFIAPLIFFFSHIRKQKQLMYFGISGLLVFSFRYVYELYAPKQIVTGLAADLYHLPNIIRFLPDLVSFYGLYKVMMNPALWILVPLLLWFVKPVAIKDIFRRLDKYLLIFLISIVIQMLLSGSMERMFYLFMPVISVIVAISTMEIEKLYFRSEK